MAATFHQRTIGVNSKTCQAKWYEVSPGEMTIQTSGSALTTFGTNASFFWADGDCMTAMHVVNGAEVYNLGFNNYASGDFKVDTSMSALYCQVLVAGGNVGYGFGVVNKAQTYSAVPQPSNGSVVWAIGGITLLANELIGSEAQLISRYRTIYSNTMVDGWTPNLNPPNNLRARTFIGYNPNTNKIVFGVVSSTISGTTIADGNSNGVSYYDLHIILKNTLGCSMALNLDGGSSTRIKYKNSTGTTTQAQVTGSNVRCQLALTSSAASTCNWLGT